LEQGKMVVENAEPGERLAQIMALLNRAVRALQLRFASQARQERDSLMKTSALVVPLPVLMMGVMP
jgi:hypothetical protein